MEILNGLQFTPQQFVVRRHNSIISRLLVCPESLVWQEVSAHSREYIRDIGRAIMLVGAYQTPRTWENASLRRLQKLAIKGKPSGETNKYYKNSRLSGQ